MRGLLPWSVLLVSLAFLAPRIARADDEAEVTCKDGTKSKGGSGACSGHGGVDKSAPSKSTGKSKSKSSTSEKSDSKSTSASSSTSKSKSTSAADEGEVKCKDGSTSKGGKGACSGHGGVDKGGAKAEPEEKAASSAKSKSKSASASKSKPESESSSSSASASRSTSKSTEPEEGEVRCKDGSTSKGGKGACSGHGGIDKGETPAESAPAVAPATTTFPKSTASAPAAPASGEKGKPTAKCKDGTLSYSEHHTGTCSNHGGVAQWLDGS